MNAAEVMTRTVITVCPNTTVADAIRLMLSQRISGLPVIDDDGALVGILSEGDLLRRAETGTEKRRPKWLEFVRGPGLQADDYVHTHGRKVGEVMTRDVVSVSGTETLEDVVELMESKRIKRVPVVEDDRLAGIVSRADLLRVLAQALNEAPGEDVADAVLRRQVVAELRRQPWGAQGRITVLVTDAVVFLEGQIYDLRERDALRVAAENVPGVKEVRDHLDYIDPNYALSTGL